MRGGLAVVGLAVLTQSSPSSASMSIRLLTSDEIASNYDTSALSCEFDVIRALEAFRYAQSEREESVDLVRRLSEKLHAEAIECLRKVELWLALLPALDEFRLYKIRWTRMAGDFLRYIEESGAEGWSLTGTPGGQAILKYKQVISLLDHQVDPEEFPEITKACFGLAQVEAMPDSADAFLLCVRQAEHLLKQGVGVREQVKRLTREFKSGMTLAMDYLSSFRVEQEADFELYFNQV